ncbi:FtsX-like permease family protein [Dactylosporangium sp. NPDC000244]|uniref:FtsX-like permease family protein n=1 Tax=Dactylosporangium sp. NPDC000244 TaxID=3154365 RepID=UPI0033315799
MSAAVAQRPLVLGSGHGGLPARRAVARWAWRLFRREWRQQAIVLALLVVAVAATTVGLAVAANAPTEAGTFGTADHLIALDGTDPQLAAGLAELRTSFGTVDVIEHGKKLPLPGSANGFDVRAQDPHGPFGAPMLRLTQGRWPQGPGEIALTGRVAAALGLGVGGAWNQDGRPRTVVGLVENPLDLRDAFALVAPGQAAAVDRVDVLIRASADEFRARPRPSGSTQVRSADASASAVVLVLATIGLVFVGLLAVAGFTVMAQRRLRALGLLGAMGASHRHIRLVLLANGAVVGGVGAVAGAAAGTVAWVALGPLLESPLGHRIDRFAVPWPTMLVAVLLATITAVVAAWWPARAAARMPVVAALSARPAAPRPAHRFAALGGVLLAAGTAALALAQQTRAPFIIGGVLATAVALLLLAPAGVAIVGRLARRAPLAPRLAMRDLARHRSRSGAALAAIALAVGIAAVVTLGAAVTVARAAAPTGGNLPADQLAVWVSPEAMAGPVPTLPQEQFDAVRTEVATIAADAHATAVALTGAVDPNQPLERNGRQPAVYAKPHAPGPGQPGDVMYNSRDMIGLFVAMPELLTHFGIDPASVHADTDLLLGRDSIDGYDLIPGRNARWQPVQQHVTLPAYGSLPSVLITEHGLARLHLTPIPVGWLVDAPAALTAAQIEHAQRSAAAAGVSVESRPTGADQARLAGWFTGAGIAVALGVLAMTVGLIRSETARDQRTLIATGARSGTRRALTAATAGALALAGAVIGTACAYVSMLAWYHREAHWLAHPPVLNLVALLVGLPVVAYLGGWLLAGREARGIARRPLE